MTTERKPEDVVLDAEAASKAVEAYLGCFCDTNEEGLHVSLRTYIAELDLIPRPQTVEEWVEQMPGSVWAKVPTEVNHVSIAFFSDEADYTKWIREIATIPRPKPPRMTDEEIDKAARKAGIVAIEEAAMASQRRGDFESELAIYTIAHDAERAKLEKERVDE